MAMVRSAGSGEEGEECMMGARAGDGSGEGKRVRMLRNDGVARARVRFSISTFLDSHFLLFHLVFLIKLKKR